MYVTSGMVVLFGLLVFVLVSIGAVIFALRHFTITRLLTVLGASFLFLDVAVSVGSAGLICSYQCQDVNLTQRIVYNTFSLDSPLGYLTLGAIVFPVLAWLSTLNDLRRQHKQRWLLSVLCFPVLLWGAATAIVLTHLPQTEQDLTDWGFAVFWGGICLLVGHGVTLVAAFRNPAPATP